MKIIILFEERPSNWSLNIKISKNCSFNQIYQRVFENFEKIKRKKRPFCQFLFQTM